MANAKRLIELGMVPELAKQVTTQLETAPTSTVPGTITQGDAVADCTPAADGTSAGTQLNLLLAELRANGVIASA